MKTILTLTVLVVAFANCTTPRYAHSPTAHNVPVLTKQGDSKIAGYYSNNGIYTQTVDNGNNDQYSRKVSQGFDVQGAVAVTNHIGIQASYFKRNEKTNINEDINFDNSLVKYKRNLLEFGAGYITQLDTKQRIMLQAYAGMGFGKTTINETGTDLNNIGYARYYNTDLTKYYVEPSITFRAKEVFAGSIATRVSVVKFRNINSNYTLNEKENFGLDSLNRYPVVFFEPAFVASFGFNKLPGFRIELQAGLSVLLQDDFLNYRPFNFSLGLAVDIRKLAKGPNN